MVVEKYFRTGVLKVSSSLQEIRDAIAIIGSCLVAAAHATNWPIYEF